MLLVTLVFACVSLLVGLNIHLGNITQKAEQNTVRAADLYINNVTDMNTFRNNVNAGTSYQGMVVALTANITLPTPWAPIGNSTTNMFRGTFDGQGYTITVGTITVTAQNIGTGLFGRVVGGRVENLNLTGTAMQSSANTTAGHPFGVLVGYMANSAVENCNITGTLSQFSSNASTNMSGGLIGEAGGTGQSNLIRNCNVNLNITSTGSYLGGIVGQMNNTVIDNCSVIFTKAGAGGAIGGIVRAFDTVNPLPNTIKNCTTNLTFPATTGSTMGGIVGGAVAATTGHLTIENCNARMYFSMATGNTVGGIVSGAVDGITIRNCTSEIIYAGSTNVGMTGLGGVAANIENATIFNTHTSITINGNSGTAYGIAAGTFISSTVDRCTAYVNITGSTTGTAGDVSGISTNITDTIINSTSARVRIGGNYGLHTSGFVRNATRSVITNCHSDILIGGVQTLLDTSGSITGFAHTLNGSKILNSTAKAVIKNGKRATIGGFAISMTVNSLIDNCHAEVDLSGGSELSTAATPAAFHVSGFATAVTDSEISNSSVKGTIEYLLPDVTRRVGGLVGGSAGASRFFNNSVNLTIIGNVNTTSTGNTNGTGGLIAVVASGTTVVDGGSFSGAVIGDNHTGGIVGNVASLVAPGVIIRNVAVTGTISGATNSGGVIGYAGSASYNINISGANVFANISGTTNTGGIIGHTNQTLYLEVSDCNYYGTLTGSSTVIGGILGRYAHNTAHAETAARSLKFARNNVRVTFNSSTTTFGGVIGLGITGNVNLPFEISDTHVNISFAAGSTITGLVGSGILGGNMVNFIINRCSVEINGATNMPAFGATITTSVITNSYAVLGATHIGNRFATTLTNTQVTNCYAVSRNTTGAFAGFVQTLDCSAADFVNNFSYSASTATTAGSFAVMTQANANPAVTGNRFARFHYLQHSAGNPPPYVSVMTGTNITYFNNNHTAYTNATVNTTVKTQGYFTNSANWDARYPWDFTNTWTFVAGLNDGFPVLRSQLISTSNIVLNYEGAQLDSAVGAIKLNGVNQTSMPAGVRFGDTLEIAAVVVGSRVWTGWYSNQKLITPVSSALPRVLTITVLDNERKVYTALARLNNINLSLTTTAPTRSAVTTQSGSQQPTNVSCQVLIYETVSGQLVYSRQYSTNITDSIGLDSALTYTIVVQTPTYVQPMIGVGGVFGGVWGAWSALTFGASLLGSNGAIFVAYDQAAGSDEVSYDLGWMHQVYVI